MLGGHLYTNIQSSFYFLAGLGHSFYSYTDTSIQYDDVSFSGICSYFVVGLSAPMPYARNTKVHFERMTRRVFNTSKEVAEDNYRANRINADRFYFGISHRFDLNKFLEKKLKGFL